MRYLAFRKDVDDEHYELIYDGITASLKPFDLTSEGRVIGRVLDKFEDLGVAVKRGNRATFALTKSGTVILEDAEHELVIETMKTVPWLAGAIRQAIKAYDWLKASPTSDPSYRLTPHDPMAVPG